MRGTGTAQDWLAVPDRFIPACAGNSYRRKERCQAPPVHPRVCGEQFMPDVERDFSCGSSPRVRGTDKMSFVLTRSHRFIPACAGNSCALVRVTSPTTVHPRVCGEQITERISTLHTHGSSPRVRGTAQRARSARCRRRFIPACAGNSAASPISTLPAPVHPRVCGEQRCRASKRCVGHGSSPRVRGTANQGRWRLSVLRFIPACAGNRRLRIPGRCTKPVHPRVCGEQSEGKNIGR